MVRFHRIWLLIRKDLMLEFRQKYILQGMVLHTVAMVYVSYLSFDQTIPLHTWNALFWLILLFSAISAVSRTFVSDSPGRQLYYYQVSDPVSLILSKILYNILLMTVLALLALVVFVLFNGNLIAHPARFLTALFLGSWGLAVLLTLVSAIAAQGARNFTLMSILSFPLILPLFLVLIRFSLSGLQGGPFLPYASYTIALTALILLGLTLALILFPFLWKE